MKNKGKMTIINLREDSRENAANDCKSKREKGEG